MQVINWLSVCVHVTFEQQLHRDLDTTPNQKWPKNKTEAIFNKMPDPFLLQTCSNKNSRYDEKQRHAKTEEENIEELQHRMFIGVENVGISQTFMRVAKANEDDTNTSCIIYPRVPIPG